MWIFTELANRIDALRRRDGELVHSELANIAAAHWNGHSPWYENLAVVGTSVVAGLYDVGDAIAGTFVDVLRLGDGVREGGWGYGRDALRLLMVVGPALRVARFGVAAIAAVDETSLMGNCTWIAATRALRLTGVRHFARLADLVEAAGLQNVTETGGAFADQMAPMLRQLGATVRIGPTPASLEHLASLIRSTDRSVMIFSVEWTGPAGNRLAHSLIAFRHPLTGELSILDRTGTIVRTLVDLERRYAGYRGIASGRLTGPTVTIDNAWYHLAPASLPNMAHQILLEVRSVPLRPAPALQPAAVAPDSRVNEHSNTLVLPRHLVGEAQQTSQTRP